MNKCAFLKYPARKVTDMAEDCGSADKGFSLLIRADDGSTMLETDVDYVHQAFQRLIDWSIDEVDQDVYAVITGPTGFYTNHRIKALPDFGWIER
jgi:hypothetical protein